MTIQRQNFFLKHSSTFEANVGRFCSICVVEAWRNFALHDAKLKADNTVYYFSMAQPFLGLPKLISEYPLNLVSLTSSQK